MKHIQAFESFDDFESSDKLKKVDDVTGVFNISRTVHVQFIDVEGDAETEGVDISFTTIEDLDQKADDYILNELKWRKASCTIYDFDNVLTPEEIEKLEELGYSLI